MPSKFLLVHYDLQHDRHTSDTNMFSIARSDTLTIRQVIREWPIWKYGGEYHFRFRVTLSEKEAH